MEDEKVVALGALALLLGGFISGNTVTLYEATQVAALTLIRARSRHIRDLLSANAEHEGHATYVEGRIFANVAARRREVREDDFDRLAALFAKLLDRFEKA